MAAEGLMHADPRAISPDEYRNFFYNFLVKSPFPKYIERTREVLEGLDENVHYPFSINAQEVVAFDPKIGYLLIQHPTLLLPVFEEAVLRLQIKLSTSQAATSNNNDDMDVGMRPPMTVKGRLHIRLSHLPPVHELYKPNITSIRSNDIGRLIQVSGTVLRMGTVKMLNASKEYICQSSKCNHRFRVYADMEQGNILQPPKACPMVSEGCKSTEFAENLESAECTDYQEVKIQEHVQDLRMGSMPRSLMVVLEDDLVETCRPGDDVVVVGYLVRRWRPVYKDRRCDVEIVLRANSIRQANNVNYIGQGPVQEEFRHAVGTFWKNYQRNPLAGRNVIVGSVCPQIYGLLIPKLAILLTVIGGVEQTNHGECAERDRLRVRSQPHLLLIGDPGTGKSQFLRFATKLVPRSVITTGIGTTNAGLTCSAVRDGTEWVLEAGALVLADRGLCCIDEFSSIREHDRTAIHEAMEQQTLSIAKAGLVCKLNARASVIAVTNPKGNFETSADITDDITVNTAIGAPLLSRFDLILILLDKGIPEWDEVVSSFVLKQAKASGGAGDVGEQSAGNAAGMHQIWDVEKLKRYVMFVKENYQPALSADAMMILESYYQVQRQSEERHAALTTIRLLESLIRLSEAHARLMCRKTVTVQDACIAVLCVEASKQNLSAWGIETCGLRSDFPEDPDGDYLVQEELLLRRIGVDPRRFQSHHHQGPSHDNDHHGSPPPPDNSNGGLMGGDDGGSWGEFFQ